MTRKGRAYDRERLHHLTFPVLGLEIQFCQYMRNAIQIMLFKCKTQKYKLQCWLSDLQYKIKLMSVRILVCSILFSPSLFTQSFTGRGMLLLIRLLPPVIITFQFYLLEIIFHSPEVTYVHIASWVSPVAR